MIEQQTVMTEDDIIKRCQAGDREAFRTVVEKYQNVLYGTAYLMTGSRTAAEDHVQEAFLAAWKNIGSFRTGIPVKTVAGADTGEQSTELPDEQTRIR